jgi:serine/threonine protein kinase
MRVIAPRLPTPVSPTGGASAASLPTDIVVEQLRRLALFCMVSVALWAVGLVMDAVVLPLTVGSTISRMTLGIDITAVVIGLSILIYIRYARRATNCVSTDAGLWLMLLNAAGIALLETWADDPANTLSGHLSWTTIVVLISGMIVTTTPRKMLLAALAAASMGPLGVWVAHLRGLPAPSALNTFVIYVPSYVCAVVATLPSHMFQFMGRRIREARELGNYHLIERLGQGGMGEVWRARHRLLVRDAAIKLVRPALLGAANPDEAGRLIRRFEREAQATAALRSEHSIRLFDFGATDDGSFYYVMELLAGQDLESLIKQFGPLPAARTMYLLRQVCQSLAEAHARGLVHRDIKPANIFVCRMGLEYDFVKVLDFGLVQFRDFDASDTTMRTQLTMHQAIGTPAYMAPEVILGDGREADRRADVYAIGCVAYFLLTGERVFAESTPMQALIDHVQAIPAPPSQRSELPIPPDVDAIVLACLEKDPDRRPQDAADLGRLIADSKTAAGWSGEQAEEWWTLHLPDLSGPLTFEERSPETIAASFETAATRHFPPASATIGEVTRPASRPR